MISRDFYSNVLINLNYFDCRFVSQSSQSCSVLFQFWRKTELTQEFVSWAEHCAELCWTDQLYDAIKNQNIQPPPSAFEFEKYLKQKVSTKFWNRSHSMFNTNLDFKGAESDNYTQIYTESKYQSHAWIWIFKFLVSGSWLRNFSSYR